MSKSRVVKRKARFESFLTIGLVLPYISKDEDLVKLLLLNQVSNKILSPAIYKHALLNCQPERLAIKRNQIWLVLLGVNKNKTDYKQFKQTVDLNRELISNVDEVIMLDVQRSEH